MPILNLSAEKIDASGKNVPAPEGLRQTGPILPLDMAFSAEAERAAKKRGKKILKLKGTGLVDTGALQTCFDTAAARRLGLAIIDQATMTSATHHSVEVPVFEGRLVIDNFATVIVERALGANLTHHGIIALIGRDVLERTTFTYNGPDGSFTLAV